MVGSASAFGMRGGLSGGLVARRAAVASPAVCMEDAAPEPEAAAEAEPAAAAEEAPKKGGSKAPAPVEVAKKEKYRPTSFGVNPRVYKDRKRNLYNRYYKSTQATALKKLSQAVEDKDVTEAKKLFSLAVSVIDKNVKRGIIHRNKGARSKSKWQKRVHDINA